MENREILSFFGTLPNVPLSSIVQYLNVPKLIMISLQFPEWKELCYHQVEKINQDNGKDPYLSLTVRNDLKIADEKYPSINTFSISLKVKSAKKYFSYLREEEKNLALLIECENDNIMEEVFIKIFNVFHPSSIHSVYTNVNSNGKIERLNLLKRIITGQTVKMMCLSGSEANIVDGNELNSVVEASKEVDYLGSTRPVPSFDFNYENKLHRFLVSSRIAVDGASEVLTPEYIKKINCRSFQIYWKIFTPEHVNVFLHSWMSGGNENVREMILVLKRFPPFNRIENQENVEEEIFEGLDPKEWVPETREARSLFESPITPYSLRFEDWSGGKDIIRSDGTVATILVLYGRLVRFIVWTHRFPWRNKRESYKQRLVECEEFLAQTGKNIVDEIKQEMSKVKPNWRKSYFSTDSEYYKESSGMRKKIIDELMMQATIKNGFEEYADYLSTFND